MKLPDRQRILVVDDEVALADLIHEYLSGQGYDVDKESDSEVALTKLGKNSYDLLLTDLNLGKINGLDLLAYCRHHAPDTAVIIFTGYPSYETVVEALRQGASEYLRKPIDLNYLGIVVQRQLNSVNLKREVNRLNEEIRIERDNLRLAVAESQMFRSFSNRLSSKLNLRDVCEEVLNTILQTIPADAGAATLPAYGLTVLHERRKVPNRLAERIRRMSYQESGLEPPGRFLLHRVDTVDETNPIEYIASDIRLPIKIDNRVIATFFFISDRQDAFSSRERAFVTSVATQATDTFHRLTVAVERHRSMIHRIFDGLSDGVVFFDHVSATPLYNPSALLLLGLPDEPELDAKIVSDKIGKSIDSLFEQFRAQPPAPREPKFELRLYDHDQLTVLEVEILPIFQPETTSVGLLIVLHNVTYERELGEYKKKWVANTSHELRTPTAVLSMFVTLLRDGSLGVLSDRQKEVIEVMFRNIKTTGRIDRKLIGGCTHRSGRTRNEIGTGRIDSIDRRHGCQHDPALPAQTHDARVYSSRRNLYDLGRTRIVDANLR